MKNTYPNNKVNPEEFDIFVGLDVDKKSMSLTIFSHDGFVKSLKMPHSSKQLIQYVTKRFPEQRIVFAYEAGPTGYGLYDDLTDSGYECLVVAASQTPHASGERVKTNRIDSLKLAEALRGGQLKTIRVPKGKYRYLRHLGKLRQVYVKRLTATKLRIKSLLLMQSIPFPAAPPHGQWTAVVMQQLHALDCPAPIRFALDQLLAEIHFQKDQVLKTTRQLRHFCREDGEINNCIRLLMTIPGVGSIVAVHVMSVIGDYHLLNNSREIGCFLGLTPTEHSTGEMVSRGRISRMGDPAVRSKLIEGAWMAIRKDPELKALYYRIRQRHPQGVGARKAIVAVARKLTTRIYWVLKNQRAYEHFSMAKAL